MWGIETGIRVTDPVLNRLYKSDEIDKGLTDIIVHKKPSPSCDRAFSLAKDLIKEVREGKQIVEDLCLTRKAVEATISYDSWLRAMNSQGPTHATVVEFLDRVESTLDSARHMVNTPPAQTEEGWREVEFLRQFFRAMYDVLANQCATPIEKVSIVIR